MYLKIEFHPGITRHHETLATVRVPASLKDDGTPQAEFRNLGPGDTARLLDAFTTWARHRNRHDAQAWNLGDEEDLHDAACGVVETINYVVAEFDEGEEASGHFGYNDGWGTDRMFDGIAWEFRDDTDNRAPWIVGAQTETEEDYTMSTICFDENCHIDTALGAWDAMAETRALIAQDAAERESGEAAPFRIGDRVYIPASQCVLDKRTGRYGPQPAQHGYRVTRVHWVPRHTDHIGTFGGYWMVRAERGTYGYVEAPSHHLRAE
jgi:hypothetical protein